MNVQEFIRSTENKNLKVENDVRISSNDFGELFQLSTISLMVLKLSNAFKKDLTVNDLSLYIGNIIHGLYLESTVRYDVFALSPQLYNQCADALLFLESLEFVDVEINIKLTDKAKMFLKSIPKSEISRLDERINKEILKLKNGVIKLL